MVDNLITWAQNYQAPTAQDFANTDAFVQYLKDHNIISNGYSVVEDAPKQGYVQYNDTTFIKLDALKELLAQYKNTASQQAGLQGAVFVGAINKLIDDLKTKAGFETVGNLPAVKPTTENKPVPVQKSPEGQVAGAAKPEQPQQTSGAAVTQFK